MHKAPELIHRRRKELNLTYDDLAKSTGVVKSTVCKWERGKAIPRVDHAIKLAIALSITPLDLLNAYIE